VSAPGEGGGYSRGPLLIAVAVALAILAVAAVDFRSVVDDVPEVPPGCESEGYSSICEQQRQVAFEERLDRAFDLEDEFRSRAWLYAVAAFATILVAAAFSWARTAPGRRRELFTDLGVGGVVWLLGGFVLNILAGDELIELPQQPIFYPGVGLLVVAGIGTLATRRPPEPEPEPEERRPAQRVGRGMLIAGYVFAGAAIVIAAVILAGNGDPCAFGVDQWVDDLVGPGLLVAGGAILCGLVALAQRHWIAALLMLGPGPFAVLIAALSTACWN
jgi:hypothetical protein